MRVRFKSGWFGPDAIYRDPVYSGTHVFDIPPEFRDQLPSTAEVLPNGAPEDIEVEEPPEEPAEDIKLATAHEAAERAAARKLQDAENMEAARLSMQRRKAAKIRAAEAKAAKEAKEATEAADALAKALAEEQ